MKFTRILLGGTFLVVFYCIGRVHQRAIGLESFKRSISFQQPHFPSTDLLQDSSDKQLTLTQPQEENQLCEGYDGILFISHVLATAGAGTLFFLSLVDSLLYAEEYNLYPYIHINNDRNKPCYDPKVHGTGKKVKFQHLTGKITTVLGKRNMACWNKQEDEKMHRPGPPNFCDDLFIKEYILKGNGLWKSYFKQATPFPFDDASCRDKPVFELKRHEVDREMHRCSELAVRSWLFQGTPKALLPQRDESLQDWLWENRKRASKIVHGHYQLLPWLQQLVDKANPNPQNCLAVHVRLTDKAAVVARDKKGLEVYQPYIEAYANASQKDGSPIYIATDDARVLDTIHDTWPKDVSSRVIVQQGVTRSTSNKATFQILQNDKHRSNTEALVEMYAMSKCSFFVHGFSGMAEAVVYINPSLHERSVNIDDSHKQRPREFGEMVKRVLVGEQ